MAEYLDIIQFQERGGGKAFAQKVGSARRRDDGLFDLFLNVLPLPDKNGSVKLVISQPRERGGYGGGGRPAPRPQPPAPRRDFEDDSEAPF